MKRIVFLMVLGVGIFFQLPGQTVSTELDSAMQQAQAQLERLEEVVEQDFIPDVHGLVRELYQLGKDLYQYSRQLSDPSEVLASFEKCFALANRAILNSAERFPIDTIILLSTNHGFALRKIGKPQEALKKYEDCWDRLRKREKEIEKSPALMKAKANLLKTWGLDTYKIDPDLFKALNLFAESWISYEQYIGMIDGTTQAREYYHQAYVGNLYGEVLSRVGRNDAAKQIYQTSLTVLEKSDLDWPPVQRLQTWLSHNLALNMCDLSHPQWKDLQEAERIFTELIQQADESPFELGSMYNNLGMVLLLKKRLTQDLTEKQQLFQQAQSYFFQAVDIEEKKENAELLDEIYDNLGELYESESDYVRSLSFYHQAMEADLKEDFDLLSVPPTIPDFFQVNPRYFLRSTSAKARVLLKMANEDPRNRQTLEQLSLNLNVYALDIVDSLMTYSTSQDLFWFFREEVYQVYEGAIGAALANQKPELALQFSNRAKAGMLMASINRLDPSDFGLTDARIVEEEREIRKKLAEYEAEIDNDPDARNHVIEYRKQLYALMQQLKNTPEYRSYYEARFRPREYSVQEIQNQLADSVSVVEYFIGVETSYVFHIKKGKELSVYPIHYDGKKVDAYYQEIQTRSNATRFLEKSQFLAHDLYQSLLGRISHSLEETLIIIPDGKLAYLPFEALVKSTIPTDNKNSVPNYLLLDHAVSYAYSIPHLLSPSPKKKLQFCATRLHAFAPKFEEDDIQDPSLKQLLNRILNGEDDINALKKIISVTPYFGEKAGKQQFLLGAEELELIYLITHGEYSDDEPNKTRIFFTPDPDQPSSVSLPYEKVYSMKLKARLIVLNACLTQRGPIHRGQGIASMAYAFSYAGAKSTVAAVMEIKPENNRPIMEAFYKYLKQGYTKTKALQQAKIDYLALNSSHPSLWAGSILTGNVDPIFEQGICIDWKVWALAVVTILLILSYLLNSPKKHQSDEAEVYEFQDQSDLE